MYLLPPTRARARRSLGDGRRTEAFERQLSAVGAGRFARLLRRSGLLDRYTGAGPVTVLAPDDKAIAELPRELFDSPKQLQRLLAFHIVPGEAVDSSELRRRAELPSAVGQRLRCRLVPAGELPDTLRIDDAQLLRTDLRVGESVAHVLDRVLVPAELDVVELLHLSDSFERLLVALEVLELEELLRGPLNFTLVAPRGLDALPTWRWHELLRPAFRRELRALVRRHVIPGRVYIGQLGQRLRNLDGEALTVKGGDSLEIGGRPVLVRNIEARNGLVHVVDGVLE